MHKLVSIEFQPQVAISAVGTTNGVARDVGRFDSLSVLLKVISCAATKTLDVKMQVSPDGDDWADLGQEFTQVTSAATDNQVKEFTVYGKYVRAVATTAGATGTVVFSIEGTAKTLETAR